MGIEIKGEAMNKATVDLLDFKTLTVQQRKKLKKELQERKQVLQARLNDVKKALEVIEKKSRR